jgi:hypothetical protein
MASSIAQLRCSGKYYIEDQSRRKERFGQPTTAPSYKPKLYTPRTEDTYKTLRDKGNPSPFPYNGKDER